MKILVRSPNWLGDAVMSLPFLRRLAERFPGAGVHVLCRRGLEEAFQGLPFLQEVLAFSPEESLLDLSRRLRRGGYDRGYVLPPSFSSALLFFMAGIPERIGYRADFRGWLLTEARPLDERFHYVRRYLGLLREEDREVGPADFLFPSEGPTESRWPGPVLAVAPGSRAPGRRWFPERFAQLINGLSEKEWPTVLLLGAPDDSPAAAAVQSACRRPVVNLCGQTPLKTLASVLRGCGALVTNESGMMHVAWAVGTPSVILAGPSEPRLTSPFGARVRILQHREIPCVPCVKNECYRLGEDYKSCMKGITVEETRKALEELKN